MFANATCALIILLRAHSCFLNYFAKIFQKAAIYVKKHGTSSWSPALYHICWRNQDLSTP